MRDWNGDGKITPADRAVDYAVYKDICGDNGEKNTNGTSGRKAKSENEEYGKLLYFVSAGTLFFLTFIFPIPNTWGAVLLLFIIGMPICMFIYAKLFAKIEKNKR